MLSTARKLIGMNISVLPVRQSDKRPVVSWQEFQSRLATTQEIEKWFSNLKNGLAVVTGKVSGGLQIVDVDSKYDIRGDLLIRYREAVCERMPNLFDKLVVQQTQSGGYHLIYRCDVIGKNEKLAQRATQEKERTNKHDKVRVLLETRGQGGYFLSSPTEGYELVHFGYEDIPVLSEEERDVLIETGKVLNEFAEDHKSANTAGLTPFDHFDEEVGGEEIVKLLEKHGWKSFVSRENSDAKMLTRPGKEKGVSATWNHVPDRFYVFSSSTMFEPNKAYKPSAVYAFLEHSADFSAAAGALASMGYGDKEKRVNLKDVEGIIKVNDIKDNLKEYMYKGEDSGVSTGFEILDQYYKIKKGQLNIITGIPGHGKSEFLDNLLINVAKLNGYTTLIYSPENYPHRIHLKKLVEKYSGIPIDSIGNSFDSVIDKISKKFFFVDGGLEGVRMSDITAMTQKMLTFHSIDMLVIDPWNELEDMRPKHLSETEYIGRSLKQIRHFARRNDIATFIVAHPTKMRKKKDRSDISDSEEILNQYAVPTLYDITGSANWFNKADNGLVFYRDWERNVNTVYIQKIKYRQYGKPGQVEFEFNKSNGLFSETHITEEKWYNYDENETDEF